MVLNNRDRIILLSKSNENFNSEVNILKEIIQSKSEEINDLKEKNSLLKSSLEYFKNLVYNLLKVLLML